MHLVCSECLGVNRIADERIADNPKCGKCQAALVTGQVLAVNATSFGKIVSRSDLPVVVDFWADWCGPCKMMAPVFSKVAQSLKGKAIFVKVDTQNEQQLAAQFNIRNIPTLKVFKGGAVAGDMAGALPESQLQSWIQQYI